jgi:hypothetical protein
MSNSIDIMDSVDNVINTKDPKKTYEDIHNYINKSYKFDKEELSGIKERLKADFSVVSITNLGFLNTEWFETYFNKPYKFDKEEFAALRNNVRKEVFKYNPHLKQ